MNPLKLILNRSYQEQEKLTKSHKKSLRKLQSYKFKITNDCIHSLIEYANADPKKIMRLRTPGTTFEERIYDPDSKMGYIIRLVQDGTQMKWTAEPYSDAEVV